MIFKADLLENMENQFQFLNVCGTFGGDRHWEDFHELGIAVCFQCSKT